MQSYENYLKTPSFIYFFRVYFKKNAKSFGSSIKSSTFAPAIQQER